MKAELFPFQKRALGELRMKSAEAVYRYQRTHSKQVVSFTAPTGRFCFPTRGTGAKTICEQRANSRKKRGKAP